MLPVTCVRCRAGSGAGVIVLCDFHAEASELAALLTLTLRYLEHPDVQALPFAMSSAIPAARIRAVLARIEGTR